jgi:endonuclease/exonuclease/phosphatase family metal-dependent hydrolase
MLKRCFIYSKYEISNGKKLVIINLHNSAFDDESELRKAELEMLKEILISEYKKGNYVIAGGDWNQNPVGFHNEGFQKYVSKSNWPIESNYLPADWHWASDYSTPTNRGVQFPFDINKTETTIHDFFVTSPNVEVLDVKTIDLGFEHSDHHPVMIRVKLGY